jgi:hypothetical protein
MVRFHSKVVSSGFWLGKAYKLEQINTLAIDSVHYESVIFYSTGLRCLPLKAKVLYFGRSFLAFLAGWEKKTFHGQTV